MNETVKTILLVALIALLICAFTMPYFAPIVHASGHSSLRWLLAIALILLILSL